MATRGVSALGAITTGVGVAGNALGLFGKKFDRTGTYASLSKNVAADITKRGVQQSNLGLTMISMPKIMQNRYNLRQTVMGVTSFVEAFNIPGRALQTSEHRRQGVGPMYRMPVGSTTQNTTTLTIISDGEGKFYKFFYLWMASIVRTEGMKKSWDTPDTHGSFPYEVAYFNEYASTVKFIEANTRMDVITETELLGAYPVSISEKQMNWNNTGLMQFTVEMAYRHVNVVDLEEKVLTFKDAPPPNKAGLLATLIKAGNAVQLLRSIKSSGGSTVTGIAAAGASALSSLGGVSR